MSIDSSCNDFISFQINLKKCVWYCLGTRTRTESVWCCQCVLSKIGSYDMAPGNSLYATM
jgi:hypothetical protein